MKEQKKKSKAESMLSARSQTMNIVIVIAILVFTFIFLFKNIYDPKHPIHISQLLQLNWGWLIPALGCLAASVAFEAINLKILCKKVGYDRPFGQAMIYSSADIYFSAITPSATGGQPAAAYYMTKSGVPLSLSTAVLILNVTLYTIGLLVISAFALILKPQIFLDFDIFQKICVIVGIVFHAILIVACFVCMFSKRVVYFLGDVFYGLLAKLHLVKNKEEKIAVYRAAVEGYRNAFNIVKQNWWLLPMLLFNGIMQRVILAPITYFVFKAMAPLGVPEMGFFDVFVMQLYCTVGASAMPLPGGAGIAETLFVGMFEGMPNVEEFAFLGMVLSRTFSSYLAIIGCGSATMIHHFRMKRAEFRRRAIDSPFDSTEPEPRTGALDGVADADLPLTEDDTAGNALQPETSQLSQEESPPKEDPAPDTSDESTPE